MKLFDNHNHSNFSFDGKRTTVELSTQSAAAKGLAGICFSEHCDFYLPPHKTADGATVLEQFDITGQQAEIDMVQQACGDGIRILKGIEIGLHEKCRKDIRNLLKENTFDQVIASIHYLDEADPYDGTYFEGKEWKPAYGTYLETLCKEIIWMKDFDIVGHYDYVARYGPYPQDGIRYRDFADIFDEMFRFMIHEGKALELNTKSCSGSRGRQTVLDPDVLRRYKEMGGEIISLGSDSHAPQNVAENFDNYAMLLKSEGFRWTAHYEQRRLVMTGL